VAKILAEMAEEERWAELTMLAEEENKMDETKMEEEKKRLESCSIVYPIAKAPVNSLSRVSGTLFPMANVDLKMKQQLLLDCGCSTNFLGLQTAERMTAKMDDASNIKLYNASGEQMSVVG
jgi:hypothetical protein